jgi:alanine racemase
MWRRSLTPLWITFTIITLEIESTLTATTAEHVWGGSMKTFYRPTRAVISLDALQHNIREFRRVVPEPIRLMAVVKANAYGHGAVQTAACALKSGVDYIGVAFLDEAIELRKAGITAPILVLGYTPPEGLGLARKLEITITAYSDNLIEACLAEPFDPAVDRKLKVHVKVDSGMGRIGVPADESGIAYIERIRQLPGVELEGLFTHYACADEQDKSYTLMQHDRFNRVVQHFRDRGIDIPIIHAGNSATGIDHPELTFSMLRLGIGMYGLYPSEEVFRSRVNLRPVMSFVTEVVMTKTLPPGSGVSYGAAYRTRGEETIATLPVGYADGYTRLLGGKASVLVHGSRAPIVGRICMDQCMINVSDIANVAIGDEVVLFGEQDGAMIHVDELAALLGTINYEIPCMISHRVPRVYVSNGEVIHVDNDLI